MPVGTEERLQEQVGTIATKESAARRVSGLLLTRSAGLAADVMIVAAAALAARALGAEFPSSLAAYVTVGALLILISSFSNSYRLGVDTSAVDDLPRVFVAFLLAVPVAFFIAEALGWGVGIPQVVVMAAVVGGALLLERGMMQWTRQRLRRAGVGLRPTLIVGAGEVGSRLARRLVAHPELGLAPIGFVDKEPYLGASRREGLPILGSSQLLGRLIEEHRIGVVMIAFSTAPHEVLLKIVRTCQRKGVTVLVVPRLFEATSTPVAMDRLFGTPIIGLRPVSFRGVDWTLKRAVDIVVASATLVLLSPVLLASAAAIKLESRGPVFFLQQRVGRDGYPFYIRKFRTMCMDAEERLRDLADQNEADGHLFKIRHDPRMTRVGRVLRRWSVDEFPQLINVLRGEMSLVGPRPPLPHEVAEYEFEDRRRLGGKPGITGLAQVSGRSDLTFEEMVELDRYYLENWSLSLDALILARTFFAVLSRKGAY